MSDFVRRKYLAKHASVKGVWQWAHVRHSGCIGPELENHERNTKIHFPLLGQNWKMEKVRNSKKSLQQKKLIHLAIFVGFYWLIGTRKDVNDLKIWYDSNFSSSAMWKRPPSSWTGSWLVWGRGNTQLACWACWTCWTCWSCWALPGTQLACWSGFWTLAGFRPFWLWVLLSQISLVCPNFICDL